MFLSLNTYIFVLKINILRDDKYTDHVSNKIKKEIFNAFFKHVLRLFYTTNKIRIKIDSVDILNKKYKHCLQIIIRLHHLKKIIITIKDL